MVTFLNKNRRNVCNNACNLKKYNLFTPAIVATFVYIIHDEIFKCEEVISIKACLILTPSKKMNASIKNDFMNSPVFSAKKCCV